MTLQFTEKKKTFTVKKSLISNLSENVGLFLELLAVEVRVNRLCWCPLVREKSPPCSGSGGQGWVKLSLRDSSADLELNILCRAVRSSAP
jgi:hypothetical protein